MLRRRKAGGFPPAASPLSVEMGGEIEEQEAADEEEKGVEYARPKKKSIYVFIKGREKAKKPRSGWRRQMGFIALVLF
jgi:hypothetical protein